ncbi:MAG: TIR domain-containing protein [Planctomycetota bacterium]
MTCLFISVSDIELHYAIALKEWLVNEGLFLSEDVFVHRDLDTMPRAGSAWEAKLTKDIAQCGAMILLVSENWKNSEWCRREHHLAKCEGKHLFRVDLEPIEDDDDLAELRSRSQFVEAFKGVQVSLPPIRNPPEPSTRSGPVRLGEHALLSLKSGIAEQGILPSGFTIPEDVKGWYNLRIPYPGLAALEEEDAAVFFGREADFVRTRELLRKIRDGESDSFLAILGASGAGKSSFLRAGVCPRLKKDPRRWECLSTVRHGRDGLREGVLRGSEGLVAALEASFRRRDAARDRAWIRSRLQDPQSFLALLEELAEEARSFEGSVPAIVLPLDQAEELFLKKSEQVAQFLELLRAAVQAKRLITVATIRTDAYERLQSEPLLSGIHKSPQSLDPIAEGELGEIIDGPARVLHQATGRSPLFHPLVRERLLAQAQGQKDALPLLAVTLKRLMAEHLSQREIGLDELEDSGDMVSTIEQEANDAAIKADISGGSAGLRRVVSRVFLPLLVVVDPENGAVRKQRCLYDEIPDEGRRLVEIFVDRRLLVSRGGEEEERTIEVTHEAVFRTWTLLKRLIEEEAAALILFSTVIRSSKEWEAAEATRRDEFLNHRGSRLAEAEQLIPRGPEWAARLGEASGYLAACRQKQRLDLKSIEDRERRISSQTQMLFAREALAANDAGDPNRAARAAVMGWPTAQERERNIRVEPTLEAQLVRALSAGVTPRRCEGHSGRVVDVCFSPNGDTVVSSGEDGLVLVWDTASLEVVRQYVHGARVNRSMFRRDGRALLTCSDDGALRVFRDRDEPDACVKVGRPVETLAYHGAAGAALIGVADGRVLRWHLSNSEEPVLLLTLEGRVTDVQIADCGLAVASSDSGEIAVFDPDRGEVMAREKARAGVRGLALIDSNVPIALLGEAHARPGIALLGRERVLPTTAWEAGAVVSVIVNADGRRAVTASGGFLSDATARIWDVATGVEVMCMRHAAGVNRAVFDPSGAAVATAHDAGDWLLWDTSWCGAPGLVEQRLFDRLRIDRPDVIDWTVRDEDREALARFSRLPTAGRSVWEERAIELGEDCDG